MFTQEVNAFLQNGGFVHLPGVAWQHRAKFLDEDIELVSPLLLGLITGHATIGKQKMKSILNTLKTFPCSVYFIQIGLTS